MPGTPGEGGRSGAGGGALLKVLKAHLFKVLNRAVFDAFMLSLYIGLYRVGTKKISP